MAYRKVEDILGLVESFHKRMRQALERVEVESRSESVEWLSKELRAHELHWQAALNGYGKRVAEGVLDTWLQYIPDEDVREQLDSIRVQRDMTLDELNDMNIRFRQALIQLYESLANGSSAPRVKELFEQLLEYEKSVIADQSQKSRESDLVDAESLPRSQSS
ncbi:MULTISPECIES: hypothetical protein [Gimesia]|uniref:Uncharacterized protein n=1 Tax=Gimesia chilikensis TaxID=2605989 RepID=A0A517PT78_9PLAN|nr:hypothetical protein [Gimesia chilikensis]QDT22579.1 hypothetical protein HG66A1_43870 [Gimesia chilikensis]